MRVDSTPARARRTARRDALLTTMLLVAAIYLGSSRLAHFDAALTGYCLATVAACFATAFAVSCFWRRPAAAFFGRALLRALLRPGQLSLVVRRAGRDLGAQRFIAPRGRLRWSAHMLLSWGTLASFALTLSLVWGWAHFVAAGDRTYQAVLFGVPVARFAVDGVIGWLVFHALNLAAVGVLLGAGYFLAARLGLRRVAGTVERFHIAPLVLLIAVAATGLALPIVAQAGTPTLFRIAALVHEATVIALLAVLPYGKLGHLFIRPLHIGAQLVRAASPRAAHCSRCAVTIAPAAQVDAVESLLTARGFTFNAYQRLCPLCRRRQLASVHAQLLGARFQPPPVAAVGRRAALPEAA